MKKQILNSAKDMWLSALFYNISERIANISFDEQKELFFSLVKQGLDENFLKFDHPPLAEYAKKDGFWEADNAIILQYLQDNFPKNATDENDIEVNNYFYDIAPPVNWL